MVVRMEVKKHRINGSGRWVFGEYDFYINGKLVAEYRLPLIGLDHSYLYFLPKIYDDCTRINLKYMTFEEGLEKAINITKKKLYLLATNIVTDIKNTKIEE